MNKQKPRVQKPKLQPELKEVIDFIDLVQDARQNETELEKLHI